MDDAQIRIMVDPPSVEEQIRAEREQDQANTALATVAGFKKSRLATVIAIVPAPTKTTPPRRMPARARSSTFRAKRMKMNDSDHRK